MQMLRELAELGMNAARALERQIVAAAETAVEAGAQAPAAARGAPDPGLALTRVARMVRLTLALKKRLMLGRIEALQADAQAKAREEAQTATTAGSPPDDAVRRTITRRLWDRFGRDRVREVVERTIETEAPEHDHDRLRAELLERLDDDEMAKFSGWSIGEAVETICKPLGLVPDFSPWKEQAWAMDYAVGAGGVARHPP